MVLSVIKNNKTVRQKNSWFSAWRCPFLGFWGRFRDHQADLKAFLCLSVLEGEATRPSASSTNKKRHPRKDVSVTIWYWDPRSGWGWRLLIQRSSNVNSASNGATNHRVVTDTEESHHLNVCRNRRQTECNQTCLNCRGAKEEKPVGLNWWRTCELSVRVHTAHSVGHISNDYRPYAVRPCVSHWTSMPYKAILCRNPGRNLPESRRTVALKAF